MRISRLVTVVCVVMMVVTTTACGSKDADEPSGATAPQGGSGLVASWSLTAAAVSSSDLSKFAITISLTDTTASGFGGVNQYTTTFTSGPDGDLDFGDIASTRMAGPQDAMNAETAYFASLETVSGYTVVGDQLQLFAGEQEVLTYTKQ